MLGQQVILKTSSQENQSMVSCRPQVLTVVSDSKAKQSSLIGKIKLGAHAMIIRLLIFIREDSAKADRAERFLNESKAKALSYHHRIY